MSELVDPKRSYSEEEYFEIELASDARHELRAYGRIVEMTGGTTNHARLCGNAQAALRARLAAQNCEVFGSDLRVKSRRSTRYFYPDASVACPPIDIDQRGRTESLANPIAVVEVLSPTTEAYDRGEKFHEYLKLDSLRAYVLIEQHIPRVDAYERNKNGEWLLTFSRGIDSTLVIRCLDVELPLVELYARVTLVPQRPDPRECDED